VQVDSAISGFTSPCTGLENTFPDDIPRYGTQFGFCSWREISVPVRTDADRETAFCCQTMNSFSSRFFNCHPQPCADDHEIAVMNAAFVIPG
jgi:hypothetical protein